MIRELPAYRGFTSASDGGFYMGKGAPVFVKQLDTELADGSEVSVFVISSANKIISQMKKLLVDLSISIVVILIVTALVMIMWIYAGIHKPLGKLSEATHRIKEGDFDFELETKGNDELSELCRDFDDMRQRLRIWMKKKSLLIVRAKN